MVDRNSPSISVDSSSNPVSAKLSLSGEGQTSWSPVPSDKNPYIKYTVVTEDGSNAKYFDVSMLVTGIDSIHVFVEFNGKKIDTNFIVSYNFVIYHMAIATN